MQCATHPSVETELTCSRCGKPICPRCLVQTPVGARCRECANVRRIPTYNIGGPTFARAAASALGAGVSVGIAWWIFNPLTGFFFGAVVGFVAGCAVGEIVSVGTNRKAGPPLQAIAVGGVALAYLIRVGLLFVTGVWTFRDLQTDLFGLIALGIASFIAAGRLR
ncbi:MAG: B-box zinc finger protein [Dehalococcoidia bacterium]